MCWCNLLVYMCIVENVYWETIKLFEIENWNIDPYLCLHMAAQSHKELTPHRPHQWHFINIYRSQITLLSRTMEYPMPMVSRHTSWCSGFLGLQFSILNRINRQRSFQKSMLTWWCHQMETFSALLALCAGNSPVTGEFPSQRPMTQSFALFFE